jgi:hypothetical protein
MAKTKTKRPEVSGITHKFETNDRVRHGTAGLKAKVILAFPQILL